MQAAYLANLTNLSQFIEKEESKQSQITLTDTEEKSFEQIDCEKFEQEQKSFQEFLS